MRRLCVWAQGWGNPSDLPSYEQALGSKPLSGTMRRCANQFNAVALGAVKENRFPVYTKPRPREGKGKRTAEGKKGPSAEHKRRKGTRGFHEELSRYYLLAGGEAVWKCPELLRKGEHRRNRSRS